MPVESSSFRGVDSLLSIVQMPAGVPVATMAVGRAGAVNAALFAASTLALQHPSIAKALADRRRSATEAVLSHPDPAVEPGGKS